MAPTLTLPATTYDAPSRLARKQLNTIIEDESNDEMKAQSRRQTREFDDLYDVSESESEWDWETRGTPTAASRPKNLQLDSRPESWASGESRNQYPSLVIPSPSLWPNIHSFPKNSPVPPTPPSKIPISPAVLQLLTPHVPTSSAPPSLDGSLTSDQLATISAPPTPNSLFNPSEMTPWGNGFEVVDVASDYQDEPSDDAQPIEIRINDNAQWDLQDRSETQPETQDAEEGNNGVQLPAGALDFLMHLTLDISAEPAAAAVDAPVHREMQQISRKHSRLFSADDVPASAASDESFSDMSIPSPGGFFSSLDGNARHTWSIGQVDAADLPPSSATAEHFYNAVWSEKPSNTVESFVEIDDNTTEGPPTAIRLPLTPKSEPSAHLMIEEIETRKPVQAFVEDYETDSTMDRTTMWLAAQNSYMAALGETNPTNDPKTGSDLLARRASKQSQDQARDSIDSPMKKAVKFLDMQIEKAESGKSTTSPKADPVFYQAFQRMANATSPNDPFIHRHARYDALQACRASLAKNHVDQLLGNYKTTDADRPNPMRPISMMPGKGEPEETAEQRVIRRVERERQAIEQVTPGMWIIEATRYLSGGRLINSPAATTLSQAPAPESSDASAHARVLDLGGQPQCDWAWHIAHEFPNVKTYTATSDPRAAAMNIRGPSNHRLVSVTNLWELPFPANHFDAISARSLFTVLQLIKPLGQPAGQSADQYDLCLKECMRVLKPGGFLEFFVLDSEIVHAGPLGTAASVEFGFNLRARGYDAAPTKNWLSRVRAAGLTDIKRAWMFLPAGAVTENPYTPPETPPPHMSMYEDKIATMEAVRGPVGSNADAAQISGLVGSWVWEQWLLKLEMEMKRGNLIEGVGKVLEEGKMTGAGWRSLSGWARKPL